MCALSREAGNYLHQQELQWRQRIHHLQWVCIWSIMITIPTKRLTYFHFRMLSVMLVHSISFVSASSLRVRRWLIPRHRQFVWEPEQYNMYALAIICRLILRLPRFCAGGRL